MGKEAFITSFSKFLKDNCEYFDNLDKLVYVENNGEEYVYAIYIGNYQKRINVTGNSNYAIMKDFLNRIGSVDWLFGNDKINKGE